MFFDRSLMGPLRDAAGAGDGTGGGKNDLTLEAIQALITAGLDQVTTKFTAEINGFDKKLQKHAAKAVEPLAAQVAELQKQGGGGKKLKKALRRLEEAQQLALNAKAGDGAAAAAAAAAAAGAGKPEPTKAERKAAKKLAKAQRLAADQKVDPFKKRQAEETEQRIQALEAKNASEVALRVQAELAGALDRALSDIPWESLNSRDLARMNFLPLVKKDEDSGEFLINGQKLTSFVVTELTEKYPNLLQAKNKGGAGASKGTGGKPAPIDFNALNASTTKEDLFAASRALAVDLAAGQ